MKTIRLDDMEWETLQRHAAFIGMDPRDYLRSIIIGGRVIPIALLEKMISDMETRDEEVIRQGNQTAQGI